MEGIAGDSPGGNVDADFEALLNDEVSIDSPKQHTGSFPKYESKAYLDNENCDAKDEDQETPVGKSLSKGLSQIFVTDISQELLKNSSDIKLIYSNQETVQVNNLINVVT